MPSFELLKFSESLYWFNSCLAGSEQKVNYWRQLADPCYPDHQRCALCNRPAYNHVVIRPVTAGAERFRLFAIFNLLIFCKIRKNFKISGKAWKLRKKRMSFETLTKNFPKFHQFSRLTAYLKDVMSYCWGFFIDQGGILPTRRLPFHLSLNSIVPTSIANTVEM